MSSLNIAAFKALLFADQKLEDLIIETETPGQRTPGVACRQLLSAQRYLRQGLEDEAVKRLKEVCLLNEAEIRQKLWAWFNLSRFGVLPEAAEGSIVRGVVLEVRVTGGIDVIAAYEGNSARYLNFSGKIIVWDLRDQEIGALCKNILIIAGRALEFSTRDYAENPQLSLLRVTLLTFNGNYRIEGDPNTSTPGNAILGQLLKGGALLMNALINRSKAMSALTPPRSR